MIYIIQQIWWLKMNKNIDLKINDTDMVLDVGGGAQPLNRADYVLDIMSYENRAKFGCIGTQKENFSKDTWIVRDICNKKCWPFKDKEFDFVLCSQVLEDIRDPIWVCQEIVRVGKMGYVEVPSISKELSRPESYFYRGYCHHRWLITLEEKKLVFFPKFSALFNLPEFQFF